MQVVVRVNAGRVPVRPKKLQRVTADRLETQKLEPAGADLLHRTQHPAEGIRLPLARGAGASPPQEIEGKIQFLAFGKAERELGADDGRVIEFVHAG